MAGSYPPLRLWPALVVGLALLFRAQRDASLLAGMVTGAAFFVVWSSLLNSWVAAFGVPALAGLSAVMAGFGALQGAAGTALDRCLPPRLRLRWLGPPLAWVLVEGLRLEFPFGGFPWGLAAHALAGTPFMALAPFGGPILVGAVAAVSAGLLSTSLSPGAARSRRVLRGLAGAASGLAVALAAATLPTGTTSAGVMRMALVQSNDQNRVLTPAEVVSGLVRRQHLEDTAGIAPGPALVVWGESSIEADPRADGEVLKSLAEPARRLGAALLANTVTDAADPRHAYNTSFLITPDGLVTDTYEKRHPVPFGEWVPARGLFGWVEELRAVPRDILPGRTDGILDIGPVRVGVLICFESVDMSLAAAEVGDGAEVIVVQTNNRSFGTSSLSAQHIETSRVLAGSLRRSVVHAGVSGRSAVILPDGVVANETGLFRRSVVVMTVPLGNGLTPYAVYGEWVVWLVLAVSMAAAVPAVVRRKR